MPPKKSNFLGAFYKTEPHAPRPETVPLGEANAHNTRNLDSQAIADLQEAKSRIKLETIKQ